MLYKCSKPMSCFYNNIFVTISNVGASITNTGTHNVRQIADSTHNSVTIQWRAFLNNTTLSPKTTLGNPISPELHIPRQSQPLVIERYIVLFVRADAYTDDLRKWNASVVRSGHFIMY